jgi:energy-coupling factor transporter ATP-binding protein EcfA2
MTGSANVRRLPNWITSYIRQTENLESPEIFRKWAGIGLLSASMERRIWTHTKGSDLYPNLYVLLVGPPGVGKSVILSHAERMLRNITEIFIAPSSVTSASLIDAMVLAQRQIFHPQLSQFNSLQVFSSELQNFLPAYEAAFMGNLTKLYDCELYEERRRTGKVQHVKIDNTQLSLLAGTTPSYLNSFLPEGAWDQGFMSRTIMVFSDEPSDTELFPDHDTEYSDLLYKDLLSDLRIIFGYYRQLSWTPGAKRVIREWKAAGEEPKPDHARLLHYNSRRTAHVIKLSMVACLARADTDLVITEDDFTVASDWLFEAEAFIPDIFKSMVVTTESRIMNDAHYHLLQVHASLGKPVPEHYLINFLKDRIPSQAISKVIEIMVRSKMLKQEFNSPVPCYTPVKKGRK